VDGYELLDAGDGERLERWGPYRLRRPDPRATTLTRRLPASTWAAVDARYEGEAGRGAWKIQSAATRRDAAERNGLPERSTPERWPPEKWKIVHDGVTLVVKLAPFKHTGVFPEQAAHWRWMRDAAARAGRPLRVLNLFAYTGGATIALARAGHTVTHVDASKPALAWARENARANELPPDAIRWIQDDAATFVARELRRGRDYDAVLLDPPAFGRAPKGSAASTWRVDTDLPDLLAGVLSLLPDPVFVLINDYARDADAGQLGRLLQASMTAARTGARRSERSATVLSSPGQADMSTAPRTRKPTSTSNPVETGHLSLQISDGRRHLDTGTFARWSRPARASV
jgi:23S rRNA (cytosine1962-C5)-methyltransferase